MTEGASDPACAGFPPARKKSNMAIPSSGSPVATHDYYRRVSPCPRSQAPLSSPCPELVGQLQLLENLYPGG